MEPDEDVIEEIERITVAEGMVDFCRDLRDSMTFYDRDVLLATYTGILESMLITALCQAGRVSAEAFAGTADRLSVLLESLPDRLAPPPGPLDIESFLQRFLEVGGQGIQETFPVHRTALALLFTEEAKEFPSADAALYSAYRDLRAVRKGALERLGRVGAAYLRGVPLSAGWLRLDGAGAEAVQSLWTLKDTYVSLPPPGSSGRPQAPVVDLSLERAVRRSVMASGGHATDEDVFWDVLSREDAPTETALAYAMAHPEVAWPLRAMMVDEELREAAEDGDPTLVNAARILAEVAPERASEGLVEALAYLDADSVPVGPLSALLDHLGAAGAKAVAGYIEDAKDLPSAVRLAPFLVRRRGRVPRDRGVFDLLASLLTRATWADGKERVAAALADYGDTRAVPLIERELDEAEPRTFYQEQVVWRALRRLKGGRRPPA